MRIFVISLHKSATETTGKALAQLGYSPYKKHDVVFRAYMNGHLKWCKDIYQDNTAYRDIPFTFIYRQLYELFPDDKFILVRRDLRSWINSLRRHLQRYPQPRDYHTHQYGYPLSNENFQVDVCRRTWERHHADVAEFFKDKPDSLLWVELDDLSWEPICRFLGCAVPNVRFPRCNVDLRGGNSDEVNYTGFL